MNFRSSPLGRILAYVNTSSFERSSAAGGSIVGPMRTIVRSKTFDLIITGVILLQAIALALEATPGLFLVSSSDVGNHVLEIFTIIHLLVVAIFISEAGMRFVALYPKPQNYFKGAWNNFDFAIVILSLVPFTGQFATIARLIRLLRVTRLVTKSRELRLIVSTLVRSIPSIFNILMLLSMLFFVYSIVGYHLFRNVDPEHWSSFLTSLMTLFQIMTLEGWVDVMHPIALHLGPLSWLYFVSFIVIGTFIIINLFISVIIRKSEEAYQQMQRESGIPLTQQEIVQEIKEIRKILEQLERRIEQDTSSSSSSGDVTSKD